MPYAKISELPKEIKKALPSSGQKMFLDVVNKQLKKGNSEGTAFQVAWVAVKKRFKKVDGKWVANSSDYTPKVLYELHFEPTGNELVVNDSMGELIVDAVLASTKAFINPAGEERYFTEEDLSELAEQINKQGSTSPTFSHKELEDVVQKYGFNYELVANELKKSRGLLKSIKAIVKEGKLWIRAMLDKRYKNHVNKFKGVSLEAFTEPDGLRLTKPKYLGFIFTNNPRDKQAIVA